MNDKLTAKMEDHHRHVAELRGRLGDPQAALDEFMTAFLPPKRRVPVFFRILKKRRGPLLSNDDE